MQKIKIESLILFYFTILVGLSLVFHAYLAIPLHNKYENLAKDNKILTIDLPPSRGIIFSEENTPLTVNLPTYNLVINDKTGLDYITKSYAEIAKKLLTDTDNIKYPIIINISEKERALLLADNKKPQSIKIQTSIKREYPYPYILSHTIGYTSHVFAEDLESNPNLKFNDIIGRAGLEKQYDEYLRGKHGTKIVEINALGQIIQTNKTRIIDPLPGADIYTALNLKMQKNLYTALKTVIEKYHIKAGAGVILNVNNGEVKAIVSYPSYDINKFSLGISSKDYQHLLTDSRKPLFNRAIMAQAPPGSTFKTMVAVAALQEKAITETTTFYSSGIIKLAGGTPFQEYHKHVYGWLTVRDALMVSSNIFFCKTILRLGIDKLDKYLEYFNIGKPTGIDLPGEASGRIPSIEEKIKLAQSGAYWLDPVWYPEGDSCNSAIGQGITLVTPIQLATVAAAIANNGIVYKPHIVTKIVYPSGKIQKIEKQINAKVPASTHVFQIVREGMHMSVYGNRGIIYNLRNSPIEVAAKTGTAEFGIKTKEGYLTTHAWIMGFYPYKKPKYAFAIFLESGGSSLRAAEVMELFLNKQYK